MDANGSVTDTAGAAISIVKTNALRADTVDWAAVEPEVRGLAAGAGQPSDVYPAIQTLLSRLNDRHSFFMRPAAASKFKSGGAENPPADVRSLPDGVGYIGVPAYGGGDPEAGRVYATRAHEALAAVRSSAGCGWVVDLRTNGGGNMWPMIAGLKPLLGSGVLGSFEGRDGSMTALTTAVGADRTGKRYGGQVEPDEIVEAGKLVWPGDDATLAAAVRWLKQASRCGTAAR